jgi:hypothetical protein
LWTIHQNAGRWRRTLAIIHSPQHHIAASVNTTMSGSASKGATMTTANVQDLDLDSVDLADPAVWDNGVPYELFTRM